MRGQAEILWAAAGDFSGIYLPVPCNGAGALDLPDCGAGGAGGGVCGVYEEVLSFA